MITHYVVEYNHDTKEWLVDDDGTVAFIGSLMPDNGQTWVSSEVDWIRLPVEEMVLLRADLAWRLRRKEYTNG
jgi:hypothetical protein